MKNLKVTPEELELWKGRGEIIAEPGVKYEYYEILTENCVMTLQPRPKHCDRGNWIMQADTRDIIELWIDHADGFPRYYFDLRVAKSEGIRWLKVRGEL